MVARLGCFGRVGWLLGRPRCDLCWAGGRVPPRLAGCVPCWATAALRSAAHYAWAARGYACPHAWRPRRWTRPTGSLGQLMALA